MYVYIYTHCICMYIYIDVFAYVNIYAYINVYECVCAPWPFNFSYSKLDTAGCVFYCDLGQLRPSGTRMQ